MSSSSGRPILAVHGLESVPVASSPAMTGRSADSTHPWTHIDRIRANYCQNNMKTTHPKTNIWMARTVKYFSDCALCTLRIKLNDYWLQAALRKYYSRIKKEMPDVAVQCQSNGFFQCSPLGNQIKYWNLFSSILVTLYPGQTTRFSASTWIRGDAGRFRPETAIVLQWARPVAAYYAVHLVWALSIKTGRTSGVGHPQ